MLSSGKLALFGAKYCVLRNTMNVAFLRSMSQYYRVQSVSLRVSGSFTKIEAPSGQNRVFLTIWHCILSAELTKAHSFRLGEFAQWELVFVYGYKYVN